MKLLYSTTTWSYCGLPDGMPLAPMCKMILEGVRLVVGAPITTAAARTRAQSQPPTLANLSHSMITMPLKEFEEAGGWWTLMSQGDMLWIPPMTIIGEFNAPNPRYSSDKEEICQSLSWTALTPYHCGSEFASSVSDAIDWMLRTVCCGSYAKRLANDFKDWLDKYDSTVTKYNLFCVFLLTLRWQPIGILFSISGTV